MCSVDVTYGVTDVLAFDIVDGSTNWRDDNIGGSGLRAPHYPTADDVYVSITSPGVIKYDATTGNREWVTDLNDYPRASPTVGFGRVYVSDEKGGMYALDPDDGSELWSEQADGIGTFDAGATPIDDEVYFAQNESDALYSLDPESGNRNWKFSGIKLRTPVTKYNGKIHAMDDDDLVAYAFDPADGSVLWSTSLGVYSGRFGGPTVGGGRVYHHGDGVHALDPADGSTLWSTDSYGPASLTYADETLYIGAYSDEVVALDATDGTVLWSVGFNNNVYVDPIVQDNILVACDRFGDLKGIDTGSVNASNGTKTARGATSHNDAFSPVPEGTDIDGVFETSDFVYDRGDPIGVGSADQDYTFDTGTIVNDTGDTDLAFISGGPVATTVGTKAGTKFALTSYSQFWQYTADEPFDIDTLSQDGDEDRSDVVDAALWNDTGTRFYYVKGGDGIVTELDTSEQFNILNGTRVTQMRVFDDVRSPTGLDWDDTGDSLHIIDGNLEKLVSYTLTAPYELGSASGPIDSIDLSGVNGYKSDFAWNNYGTKAYVLVQNPNAISQFNASVPYDITTLTLDTRESLNLDDTTALDFNQDGSKLYVVGEDPNTLANKLNEYTLSANFDISTRTLRTQKDLAPLSPLGIAWNENDAASTQLSFTWSRTNRTNQMTSNINRDVLPDNGSTSGWKVNTFAPSWISPVVTEDYVYSAEDNGNIYKWDKETGDTLQQNNVSFSTEPWRSGLALSNSQLYFGSFNDPNVLAIDTSDLSVNWRFQPDSDVVLSTPVIFDDLVIFGDRGGKIYALDETDGTPVWTTSTSQDFQMSPAYDGEKCVFGSRNDKVLGIDPANGSVLWENADVGGCRYGFTFCVDDEDYDEYFIGMNDSSIVSLNPSGGGYYWKYTHDHKSAFQGAYDRTEGRYCFCTRRAQGETTGGFVYYINISNGSEIWESEAESRFFRGNPIIGDSRIYAPDEQNGQIVIMNKDDGSTVNTIDLPGTVKFMASDGHAIYGGDEDFFKRTIQ